MSTSQNLCISILEFKKKFFSIAVLPTLYLCISILEFKIKEIADIIREDDEFMYFYIRI